jgi:hypothetical protein
MLQCQILELALVSDTDYECGGPWACAPMSCDESSSLPGSTWGWRMGT